MKEQLQQNCTKLFLPQEMGDDTPKKEQRESLRSQKENLQQLHAEAEMSLVRRQREFLEIEVRKFRRRKLLKRHLLETDFLKEVGEKVVKFDSVRQKAVITMSWEKLYIPSIVIKMYCCWR